MTEHSPGISSDGSVAKNLLQTSKSLPLSWTYSFVASSWQKYRAFTPQERGRQVLNNMTKFQKALAWAAIPVTLASIISTVPTIADPQSGSYGSRLIFLYGFWHIGLVIWLFALLFGMVWLLGEEGGIGRREADTRGIWAGVGIGLFMLSATCSANLIIPAW